MRSSVVSKLRSENCDFNNLPPHTLNNPTTTLWHVMTTLWCAVASAS